MLIQLGSRKPLWIAYGWSALSVTDLDKEPFGGWCTVSKRIEETTRLMDDLERS